MLKESCSNCAFYQQDDEGDFYCNDCDGLYFNWARKPDQHCPDYKVKNESVTELKNLTISAII